jgi:hypothetical protein
MFSWRGKVNRSSGLCQLLFCIRLKKCEAVAGCPESQEASDIKQFVFSAIDGESTKAKGWRDGDDCRTKDDKCVFHSGVILVFFGD